MLQRAAELFVEFFIELSVELFAKFSLSNFLLSSPSSSSSESRGERGKSELDLCGCSKRILEHHKKENNLACHVNRLHNNSLEQLY